MSFIKVIVAEKDPVAKRIACALCRDHACEREQECPHEHADIFVHYRSTRGCSSMQKAHVPCTITSDKGPFYFQCRHDNCSIYVASTDEDGKAHAKRTWKRINSWRAVSDENKKKITPMRVKYFEIDDDNAKTIILATNGTILDVGYPREFPWKIEKLREWESVREMLRYYPVKDHRIKWNLLEEILVEEHHFGKVDEVILATDYDVAGSYIALSILEESNRKRREKGKGNLPVVKRLVLKTLLPEEIEKELKNPKTFDWGNALGGKLRKIVDLLFGNPLSDLLRRSSFENTSRGQAQQLKCMGIGRVQFPILWFIINRDWEAAKNNLTYAIYLLVKGFNTKAELEESLKNQNVSAFLVKEHRSHYSQSQLIRDLAKYKIGTHTTRFTTIRKLERRGLVRTDDKKRIRGTRLGRQFYNMLRTRLCTDSCDFASLEFNRQLYENIESLRALDQEIKDGKTRFKACQKQFNCLMQQYYRNIRELVLKFRTSAKEIRVPMVVLLSRPAEQSANMRESESNSQHYLADSVLTIEGTNPVDIEFVEKEIGSIANLKEIQRKLKRLDSTFKEFDLAAYLRFLLQIPRENDFEILESFAIENIVDMNEGNTVLYKAHLEENTEYRMKFDELQQKIKDGTPLSSMEMVKELDIKKRVEVAHEPLHTVGLQYRNVEGKKGRLLIMEYDRPYMETLKQLVYFDRGLVKAFTWGDMRFELVDPYSFFEAHNYESMLFAMHEKYDFDFDETAKMMQRLYIGGEVY